MIIGTYVTRRRRCSKDGKRTQGGCYMMSIPSPDGALPLWVDIDPPIEYAPPGGAQSFRIPIHIDLEKLLEGEEYEEYIRGASAERQRRRIILEPEIEKYGMAIKLRKSLGICRTDGLSALTQVAEIDRQGIGRCIRSLQRCTVGKAQAQALRLTREWQDRNPQAMLATAWRIWLSCSDSQKERVRAHLGLLMEFLNAREDALALGEA